MRRGSFYVISFLRKSSYAVWGSTNWKSLKNKKPKMLVVLFIHIVRKEEWQSSWTGKTRSSFIASGDLERAKTWKNQQKQGFLTHFHKVGCINIKQWNWLYWHVDHTFYVARLVIKKNILELVSDPSKLQVKVVGVQLCMSGGDNGGRS